MVQPIIGMPLFQGDVTFRTPITLEYFSKKNYKFEKLINSIYY